MKLGADKRITHGLGKSKLWSVWSDMRHRCQSVTHHAYPDYGARGIGVAVEWQDYANFYHWALNNGYAAGLSLDRINNDLGYSPDNCRWATKKMQNNNKRDNRIITIDGRTQTLMQWSDEMGKNYWTVWSRIQRGWSPSKALKTPLRWERG